MIDLSIVEQYVLMLTPVVTAIAGILAVVLKVMSSVKDLKKQVKAEVDFSDVKTQLNEVIKENAALKKQNRLVLEQLTRVKNYDEEIQNQ